MATKTIAADANSNLLLDISCAIIFHVEVR